MNADAYFTIGRQHHICQDYATAGGSKDFRAFAALSDGCSSSPHTDFGSRFLCRGAASLVRGAGWDPYLSTFLDGIRHAQRAVELPVECLDATLLLAWFDNGLQARVYGDGVVVGRRRDGGLVTHSINFPSGAPMYPAYWLSEDRLSGYIAEFGTTRLIATTLGNATIVEEIPPIGKDGEPVPVYFRFDPAEYDLVLLLSDGVHSFQREVRTDTSRSFEAVPVEDVVREIAAIKGFAGEFITRRVKRFLKDADARGWHHNDDLAVAGVWLGEAP